MKKENSFKLAPSYYALLVTGTLLLINVVIIVKNYKKIITEKPYHIILLVTCIGLLAGIHGLLHLGLEKLYNYNPIFIIKKKVNNLFNRKRKQNVYPNNETQTPLRQQQ